MAGLAVAQAALYCFSKDPGAKWQLLKMLELQLCEYYIQTTPEEHWK